MITNKSTLAKIPFFIVSRLSQCHAQKEHDIDN